MNNTVYIELDKIENLHDEIIACCGEESGLSEKVPEDSLQRILKEINIKHYRSFLSKLINLIFPINEKKFFKDGNKRTSVISGAYFLLENGYSTKFVKHFILAMGNVMVWIDQTKPSKNNIELIIKSLFFNPRGDIGRDICNQIDEIQSCLGKVESLILTQMKIKTAAYKTHAELNCSKNKFYDRVSVEFLEVQEALMSVKSNRSMMELQMTIFNSLK